MIDLKLIVVLAAVLPVHLAAQETQLESLPLYYDVRTGNVTIDTTDVLNGVLFSYAINAPPCCSIPLRSENHTPFMGGPVEFVTSQPSSIGEVNLSEVPGGVYSLGEIFPIGLTEGELLATYFDGGGGLRDGRQYNVTGPVGSASYHLLQPIYSASPFPALNDGTVGPPAIEQWADDVSLVYDSISGELSIDSAGSNGGAIWSYRIVFAEDSINADQFVPATELRTASVDATSITEVGFAGIPAGVHSLGPVMSPGLSEADFLSALVTADFIGEPGTGVSGLDLDASGLSMTIAIVPEPAFGFSCTLVCLLFLFVRNVRAASRS